MIHHSSDFIIIKVLPRLIIDTDTRCAYFATIVTSRVPNGYTISFPRLESGCAGAGFLTPDIGSNCDDSMRLISCVTTLIEQPAQLRVINRHVLADLISYTVPRRFFLLTF